MKASRAGEMAQLGKSEDLSLNPQLPGTRAIRGVSSHNPTLRRRGSLVLTSNQPNPRLSERNKVENDKADHSTVCMYVHVCAHVCVCALTCTHKGVEEEISPT